MARARGTRVARANGRTSVVVVGGGTGRRIARVAGRAAARAGAAIAREEKHTLTALGAAAFMGAARRFGWNLPTIGGMSPALVFGLGAWAVGKWSKNEVARHLGTGLLAVGIFDLIAYTRETREGIDSLLETQRADEEATETSGGPRRRALGSMGG